MSLAHIFASTTGALVQDPTWIFFLVLAMILLVPLLLRKLHIPHVIGLILAGMLVGKYGFHILERDSSFQLFGQVGIYYIMFLAALELDIGSVQHYGKRGFQLGLLTFLVPFVLGFAAGHYLLNYSVLTSLMLSCILSSHTLVSYPIVGRYGLGRHKTIIISVVATAFATFAALLTLALVVGWLDPETGIWSWILFGTKCIAYGLFVVLAFPRIGRWFLRNYDDSVLQYIFILALVFLSAALAELVGLEGLLGAFLAGLSVNRLIPRNSPLMTRIEFVGNALFIPYFLIGVGMIIDLRVVLGDLDTLWVIFVVAAVATFSKLLAAVLMNLFSKGSKESAILMFGLTNAHAAGALAIVMIGTSPDVGLMDETLLSATIMLILISCILSSMATTYGAKQLALSDTTLEENKGSYHGKCMVVYEHSENARSLTQLGLLIRNPYIPDSLLGVHVAFDDENGENHRRGKKILEEVSRDASAANIHMTIVNRVSTNIVSGILHTQKEYEVGETILSIPNNENGIGKTSLGNTIDNVLSGSHRELMAVQMVVAPNTWQQIIVIVPQKAEYEVGFYKWLEHLCRIGEHTGCKMEFHSHPDTTKYISNYITAKHNNVRTSYQTMLKWKEFHTHFDQMGKNQMLIIVSARPGFISYQPSFDVLPLQIRRHFSKTNIMLLYPDQWGDPSDTVSIFAPNGQVVTRHPISFSGWMKRIFLRT